MSYEIESMVITSSCAYLNDALNNAVEALMEHKDARITLKHKGILYQVSFDGVTKFIESTKIDDPDYTPTPPARSIFHHRN